ncbi:MAG: hypothetical protein CSA55_01965 [Ilumatobacter coccineus]|uniref:RlpA-like protein double-psi beta-barrel domain-containing protein n=1 Tax=Ilumatobacter coccineus TaxID=467094 RepID=A0A2G6KCN8_9ACTN|nr:MAG: hypothetical protein CSA55_01965 [Ilumatobacter coccineus]
MMIALVITIIAIPVLIWSSRQGNETTAIVTTGEVIAPGTTSMPPTEASTTGPLGTAPAAYLGGTLPPTRKDPATIRIPRPSNALVGDASFDEVIGTSVSCAVKDAPYGIEVTVTNLDNSRSIRCLALSPATDLDAEVVLHRDAFAQIADLTDAPIPVEYFW